MGSGEVHPSPIPLAEADLLNDPLPGVQGAVGVFVHED